MAVPAPMPVFSPPPGTPAPRPSSPSPTVPAAYCRKLRQRPGETAWLVVEKILLRGETLPRDWDCDGTTGYDFMNDVSALQHDAAGEACLAEAWSSLSGRPADFAPEEQT